MKIALPATGFALLLLGLVWILQGVNVLPGTFMAGQPFWAWMGILSATAGVTLLYLGLKGRRQS